MKKLLVLFVIVIIGFSCSPYQRLKTPVTMKYSVNLEDHGSILCRDYKVCADTVFVFDAGYNKNLKKQHYVADCKFIGKWNMMIVLLKDKNEIECLKK